jgi:hypothetical protein
MQTLTNSGTHCDHTLAGAIHTMLECHYIAEGLADIMEDKYLGIQDLTYPHIRDDWRAEVAEAFRIRRVWRLA